MTQLLTRSRRRDKAGTTDKAVTSDKAEILTPRELEVTRWLVEGYQSGEVAIVMDISMKSVEVHACNTMIKLGAGNRVEMVRAAIHEGIVPCPCVDVSFRQGSVGDAQELRAALKRVDDQISSAKGRRRELLEQIAAIGPNLAATFGK